MKAVDPQDTGLDVVNGDAEVSAASKMNSIPATKVSGASRRVSKVATSESRSAGVVENGTATYLDLAFPSRTARAISTIGRRETLAGLPASLRASFAPGSSSASAFSSSGRILLKMP